MGRSQVEYNRKHGRGRGGRGGRASGRAQQQQQQQQQQSSHQTKQKETASSALNVPRHLQPTTSTLSKERSKILDGATSSNQDPSPSSPTPSYLAPTSSSAAKTGKFKHGNTSNGTNNYTDNHHNNDTKKAKVTPVATTKRYPSTPNNPINDDYDRVEDRKHPLHKSADNDLYMSNEPMPSPVDGPRSKKKDRQTTVEPLEPLPDSPEQRLQQHMSNRPSSLATSPIPSNYKTTTTAPSSPAAAASSALLLYQSHSHVTVPKPHDTPILACLSLNAEQLARTLEYSLNWYERIQIDPYIALSVDPALKRQPSNNLGGDDGKVLYDAHTHYPTQRMSSVDNNHNNDKGNNQSLNDQVDDLLQEEAMLELESVQEEQERKQSADFPSYDYNQMNQRTHPQQYATDQMKRMPGEASHSSQSSNGVSPRTTNSTIGGSHESRLMQRARRYKQQQQHAATSTTMSAAQGRFFHSVAWQQSNMRKQPPPDPPALQDSMIVTATAADALHEHPQQQSVSDWDLTATVSDLTTPSVLHRLAAGLEDRSSSSNNKNANFSLQKQSSGMSVITRILPEQPAQPQPVVWEENNEEDEEDDMDEWLDSALKSKSHDDEAKQEEEEEEEENNEEGEQQQQQIHPSSTSSNSLEDNDNTTEVRGISPSKSLADSYSNTTSEQNQLRGLLIVEPTTSIDLDAFAEDDDENDIMEDWLDSQI